LVVATDTVLQNGAMLARQGKVAYVGDEIPAEAKAGATVLDYGTATIVPGFVLPPSALGRDRDLAEGALAFTPDLRVSDAFDPWQEELLELPRFGITSLALSASPRNVAGGIGALVKPGRDAGSLAQPELHLALSLAQAARQSERHPTSLMGAVDLLRSAFNAARSGAASGPDAAVLRQVMQGGRRVSIAADTYTELVAALDLAKEFGFEPLLLGARDADKLLPRLVAQKAAVALESLRIDQRQAQLQLPTRLAEAGVPFCFTGAPGQLRWSAVLAVRAGLDRKTALAALTRAPATMLDLAGTVGSLRQGCAADFTVWSGDPLDLDTTHLATFVDGVRVHGDAPQTPSPTPSMAAPAAAGGR
jgi:imidazolonepropionase-like amidohydrolase